jgi:DNA-binding NtrC family response regulator
LRERPEDIPQIIQHLLHTINALSREVKITGLTPDAMQKLTQYAWPGNVRELRNALEYATVLCPGGEIGTQHLPPRVTSGSATRPTAITSDHDERKQTIAALKKASGNQCKAAELLGVSRVTVWKRLKKYGIKPREIVASETEV